jgi:hypothetical protein
MICRQKFITNSSSSSYVIEDAVKMLKSARRLLRSAACYELDDGRGRIPELQELVKDVQAALQDYEDHKALPVEEFVKLVQHKEW